jgi:hypothetical protein
MGSKVLNAVTGEVENKKILSLLKVGRVQNEKEAKLVCDVYDRFSLMDEWRKTSCPWTITTTAGVFTELGRESETQYETEQTSSAVDWNNRWIRDRELAFMKSGKNKYDTDLPAVSVPIVWSAKQTIINQYQDSNISITIEPKPGVQKLYAKTAEAYIQDLEDNQGIKEIKTNLLFPETVVCGTAISFNGYVKKERKVKKMKTTEELIAEHNLEGLSQTDPEMYQQVIDTIKSNPESITYEDTIVDYDNPVCEFVPLEEMFVDPGAWDFNSVTRDARDCIWRQFVSVQQVLADYENSEDIFVLKDNVKKDLILSSGAATQFYTDTQVNQELTNLLNLQGYEDKVCLIKYYNKYQDQYIVIANDIVIRSGPLPYNHKLLPFSKYIFLPIPRSFYGVGLGTLLDETQKTSELFESLETYLAELNNNVPNLVYGENLGSELENHMSSSQNLKAGSFIPAKQGESVTPIITKAANYDFDNIQSRLEKNAIQTTFINPTLSTNPSPNLAVRSAQMGQESGLLAIRSYIQNFEQGYVSFAKQALSIAKQFEPTRYAYTEALIEKAYGSQATKKQLKKLKLQGISLKDGIQSDESMIDDVNGSDVELTQEILTSFENLDLKIRVESTQLASKQLQAQNLKEMLQSVIAVRSNPDLREDKITNAVLKVLLDKSNMPPNILNLLQSDESNESIDLAMLQNDQMKQGIPVESIPGEDEPHKEVHGSLLAELLQEIRGLDQQINKMAPAITQITEVVAMGMADPMMLQQLEGQVSSLVQKKEELNQIIDIVQQHLTGDMQRKDQADVAMVTMAQQALQPPMPPQGQMQQPEQPMNPMSGI